MPAECYNSVTVSVKLCKMWHKDRHIVMDFTGNLPSGNIYVTLLKGTDSYSQKSAVGDVLQKRLARNSS
jgi:hypothetical protein